MKSAIEAAAQSHYSAGMRSLLLRLLAFVAVMLMPFGMAVAPAAHHEQTAAMSMRHCPDEGSKPHSKGALADCTMACASALPAYDLTPLSSLPVERPPLQTALLPTLSGIEMEIATPPPRLS